MLGMTRVSGVVFIVFVVLAAVLEVGIIYGNSHPKFNMHVLTYGNILLILGFSIFSSAAQAYKASMFFPAFLVLLSVSYIDLFFRMIAVFIACCAVFLWTVFQGIGGFAEYPAKATSIALEDLVMLLFFLILSIVLHYTRQSTRLRQFVVYLRSQQMTRELEVKSSFDTLTSLLNRSRFMSMAGEVLRRERNDYMAICLVDLDNFKQINDKLGHQMGDKAIQLAGQAIIEILEIDTKERWSFPERAVKEGMSFAGRLGGDEFIILMRGNKDLDEAIGKLKKLLDTLNAIHFEALEGLQASLGLAEIADNEKDIDNVYRIADDALYDSKRAGKNQVTVRAK
jgi:diguanylate cyclase (GGDEF)-like protein